MNKNRLEAFSDGVLAIVLTIMVLELKVPHGHELSALLPLVPKFGSYVLSFVYVGIYWNNHHHLLQVVERVNGRVLWANQHLLFWLSMIPFVTAWSGESHFAEVPVASYGVVLFMAAVAYFMLTRALLGSHAPDSRLARALGSDAKGKLSTLLCGAAIPLAFVSAWLSLALYAIVALIWFVPDKRISKVAEGH
jgi:uncharacterized membrane protein